MSLKSVAIMSQDDTTQRYIARLPRFADHFHVITLEKVAFDPVSFCNQLAQYADKSVRCYLLLHDKQLHQIVLDTLATPVNKQLKQAFLAIYSYLAASTTDLNYHVKLVWRHVSRTDENTVTLFRSGLASADELIGLIRANQHIGASLAYINCDSRAYLLNYITQSLANGRHAFLDNGLITKIRQGKNVNCHEVFQQYIDIVYALPVSSARRLHIVIPDEPLSASRSLQIVATHKKQIEYLARRANVILPVHRCHNIVKHARDMLASLDKDVKLTLGVPCKANIKTSSGKHRLRLSIEEIQMLFNIKKDNGNLAFKSVHYFALSEHTRGKVFEERVHLANLYNIKASADACRTTALIGNEANSERQGSVVMRQVSSELWHQATLQTEHYKHYSVEHERDEPLVTLAALDLIELDVLAFVKQWNAFQDAQWSLDIDGLSLEQAQNYCEEFLMNLPGYLEADFHDALKGQFWKSIAEEKHKPTSKAKRSETFTRLFCDEKRDAVQETLPL